MKIAYIRVSSILQNTARQLEGLEFDKTFTDQISGKDTKRAAFLEMIGFVREGDQIFVHSIDRLSRSLKDLKEILAVLKKKKVVITFLKENLTFNDVKNPTNDLLFNIIGSIAEFERELILERQREGIEIAKRNGKYAGRKSSLNAKEIIELKEKIQQRYNKSKIAKEYKISRATLYKYSKLI